MPTFLWRWGERTWETWFPDKATQKNRKMHWTEKSEKPPSWLAKTKNHTQRLNWKKPAKRTRDKNRTKNWPNPQNRKSQRPPRVVPYQLSEVSSQLGVGYVVSPLYTRRW